MLFPDLLIAAAGAVSVILAMLGINISYQELVEKFKQKYYKNI